MMTLTCTTADFVRATSGAGFTGWPPGAKCSSLTFTASPAGIEEQVWPPATPEQGKRAGQDGSPQVSGLAKFRSVEEPA